MTEIRTQDGAAREHAAFWRQIEGRLKAATKLKAVMHERGIRSAKAKCPRCQIVGALQGRLAGRRDHLRMWCETEGCDMGLME